MVRKTVYYSGRVQGVFFRASARRIASEFQIGGYVRNLPDGRVELVAEGEPLEVDGFLAAVAEHYRDHIRESEIEESAPIGEFDGFQVRH